MVHGCMIDKIDRTYRGTRRHGPMGRSDLGWLFSAALGCAQALPFDLVELLKRSLRLRWEFR